MQVSIQLMYMSCFPHTFDKIFMCSLQIYHCHSQSLSLSECFEHNFILLSIDWHRLKKPSKLLDIFIYIYFFFFFFFFYIYIYIYYYIYIFFFFIYILLLLLLLLVGDIPFTGDFNKSAVR